MKAATILSLCLGITFGIDRLPAQDQAELELDHNVKSTFVTPHTAWAKPYVSGTTRVLFFVDGRGTNPREVVELKQRFDLDPQMVFWTRIIDSTQEQWHGADLGIHRMARLLEEHWDAFVFLDVPLERVPVEQQYTLLKAVTSGAGLVLIGFDDKRVLKGKNRLKDLPSSLRDVAGASAFLVLKGRGVLLPKRPAIEYRPGWEMEYDEWAMRTGKAILWAAGREPALKLKLELTPPGNELARTDLPGMAKLSWQEAVPGCVAEVSLRRKDGLVVFATKQPLGTSRGVEDIDLPKLRSGKYYLDIIARKGDRVAGFDSTPFSVTSKSIVRLHLDPDWAEAGESLAGKVEANGDLQADTKLIVSLFDHRSREIARQTLKPKPAAQPFQFAVQPWFPMLLGVRATLIDGTGEITSDWQFAHMVKRNRGQFNFVMWDTPHGNLAPFAEQALAESGVTAQLRAGSPEPWVAAQNIAWIPYTTHVSGGCKPVCWNDEAKIQKHVDEIVNKHVPARRHGVFVYSLGDEIAVRGSCTGPCCLDAYRKYLQESYGDIAALNASWSTRYESFDQVQLSKPEDNDEAASLESGNFPRWFDRQTFQSRNFAKLCERFGKGFQRLDPQSLCGFEGAGTFTRADDLDAFVRSNTFWSPYPGTADEVLRSIAPRNFPRANWMGYTKDADSLLEKYWRMVTRGCDAVWWWRWDALGRFHGWLSPTLDPYPAVQEILKDTQIVRDGLGDLLLRSEMQTDGIGILYSLPSAYASKVQTSPSFGSYEGCHTAFHHALRELGLNFSYFTDRQLQHSEVDLSKFKVVLLPLTQAMSSQEAERFRKYVSDGGMLIADVRPAIYDGHVKPLAMGKLDDVFGVKRTGFDAAKVLDAQLQPPSSPILDLRKARVDASVAASGAQAWGKAGETPLFLVHSFGKGQAVLLNLPMSSYPALGAPTTDEAAANILQKLLHQALVEPALRLATAQGQRLRNVEITRWRNGPAQLISIFRHSGQPEAAKLATTGPQHCVFDLKNRKEFGSQQSVDFTVSPSRASFFAILPQPPPAPLLKAAPRVSPGAVQKVAVTSRFAGAEQAVKLRVRMPNGSPADWVHPIVIAGKKAARVDIPLALNDPCGEWTIEATELFTGRSETLKFTVESQSEAHR